MRSAVLDVGTGFTKAGFSGEEAAREVFRSCVGEPRHRGTRPTLFGHATDIVAGDEAYADRGVLDMRWPVQHGHVVDMDQWENLLYYGLYNRLEVAPDMTPCLMLEPADQTRECREKVAELLFESFNVPLVGTLNTATATAYATGRTTGLVVDSGAGKTMISAVCDGYVLGHAMRPSHLAGNALTDDLVDFLRSRGYPMSVQADWELADRMKEMLCRASTDDESAEEGHTVPYKGKTDGGAYYELPDSERIFLLEAETQLAERLFNPSVQLTNSSSNSAAICAAPATPTGYSSSNPLAEGKGGASPLSGWADTIYDVIAACPSASTRVELCGNVVLGGGTTMMQDVERRLQKDLVSRRAAGRGEDGVVPKVVAFPHRAQAAWVGGSVWAASTTYPSLCLSKADYYEGGAGCVHKYAF